jgi:prepilin-type processing-associated H-X9-DG protein
MRSAAYDFGPDGDAPGLTNRQYGFTFGSAHSGGMNVVYADASVHFVQYDVDPAAFNRMGNRSDGEQLTDPVSKQAPPRL